ncbi:MAG: Cro/CI family transcriptional regulator [Pseudomonadales bacterium]|nr:Cro/CI family transcriptional regulator [Pseudomonadales bacterium]NRA15227.1 hypothetical protein [Oceanospirillaceae bacterium]
MYKQDAIDHLGSVKLLHIALGITSGAVSQWGKIIPEKQAMRLERITGGALKYDPSLYSQAA